MINRLELLTQSIKKMLRPVSKKPYLVFHDAYQYFEKRFALNGIGSVTLSPEKQPGARLDEGSELYFSLLENNARSFVSCMQKQQKFTA